MVKILAFAFVLTGLATAVQSILRTRETRFLKETGSGKTFVIFDRQVERLIATIVFLNNRSISESPLFLEVGLRKMYWLG
ncbi:MAG: hypothetical protein D6728_12080 [Cyanobacteria bacterium J055]|nr:MAG: hypothetical protein D6728_12080 [Cyanobacteria bacterium J055]